MDYYIQNSSKTHRYNQDIHDEIINYYESLRVMKKLSTENVNTFIEKCNEFYWKIIRIFKDEGTRIEFCSTYHKLDIYVMLMYEYSFSDIVSSPYRDGKLNFDIFKNGILDEFLINNKINMDSCNIEHNGCYDIRKYKGALHLKINLSCLDYELKKILKIEQFFIKNVHKILSKMTINKIMSVVRG